MTVFPKTQGKEITTHSANETFHFGKALAESLERPYKIFLEGSLGMGKTVLAKGILCGLGVVDPDDVVSPTFTLIQHYKARWPTYHVDLYRLDSPAAIESLGLEDLLADESNFVVVEWAEKLTDLDYAPALYIKLEDAGEDDRRITLREL